MADNFTTVSLNTLVDDIEKLIEALKDTVDFEDIVDSLRLNVLHLSTYQTRLVEPMTEGATNMVVRYLFAFLNKIVFVIICFLSQRIANETQEKLKFNYPSFEDAIAALIAEVLDAQETLKEDGRDMLIEVSV